MTSHSSGQASAAAAEIERRLGAGLHALQAGQAHSAKRHFARLLTVAPDHAEGHHLMGLTCHMCGDHDQAVIHFRRALQHAPDNPMTHMGLGIALHDRGDLAAAISSFERACELAPDMPACRFNLGKALTFRAGDMERACDELQRAVTLRHDHVPARLTLANTLASLGRIDAAVAQYRHVLDLAPDNASAWHGLANVKSAPFSDRDAEQIQRAWKTSRHGSDACIRLGFALARAQEDQGDHMAAFATLREANADKRRTLRWDARAEHTRMEATLQAFGADMPAPTDPARGGEVIFIVSVPRSGSTLIEQILASHRDVDGAGEITDLHEVLDAESRRRGQDLTTWCRAADAEDWERLGRTYLQRTAHLRRPDGRFTDKNLLNWKFVGAARAMLPGARFISCRRDPLETCLACFRQLFRTGNPFSYDLAEMAAYWKDYDRLSRHWLRLFPDYFFEIRHETLLADPQAGIRRLLDICALDFDPDCLNFHATRRVVRTASAAQVRQPMRRETARAHLYGDALTPLRALLEGTD